MKYFIILSLLLFSTIRTNAQTPIGQSVAEQLATRMKDSLGLTDVQRDSVYQVNIMLHNLEQAVRQPHVVADSLGILLQRIENKRDSLYRTVIPIEKFLLYRQKKTNIIRIN